MDNGPVVCALLDGQICSAYYNMRHLDDLLVFVWTWTRTSIHRPPPSSSAPIDPPLPKVLPLAREPHERISLFINAHITSVILDLDLTPLTRINLHMDNLVGSLCPGSGRYCGLLCMCTILTPYSMEDSSRIGSFILNVYTGEYKLLSSWQTTNTR